MQILLKVTHGPHRGKEFSFDAHDTFIVGRGRKAHFRLPKLDGYFSRNHFMLEINPPNCVLVDMASTNGTYVNKQRVEQAFLNDNDLIQGGNTAIRVAIKEAVEKPVEEGLPDLSADIQTPQRPAPPWAAPAPPATDVGSTEDYVAESPPSRRPPPEYRAKIEQQPQPFAGYQIIERIGHGGMGNVFLAWREATGMLVALKTIRPAVAGDEVQCQRFLREAEILREIHHPHIVAYEDAGFADGTMYFVMEYVPGKDVRELLLEQNGPLPIGQAVRIICQTLEGLADAHSRGFVHRDVKPANLLMAMCDGRPLVKVADFGLARMYHASQLSGLTVMGDTGGTIPYMAPEQITNYRESKPAVDQYSAAATLYHLLTNRYVFDFPEETGRKLLMVLQEDPVPIASRVPGIPEELAVAVHRGLAREPSDRFEDCMLFREALLPFYNVPHAAG
jgi:serine/threonine-protein kinase